MFRCQESLEIDLTFTVLYILFRVLYTINSRIYLLMKKIVFTALLLVSGLTQATDLSALSHYYLSGKVGDANLQADNMNTSLRPGIGNFVAGEDTRNRTQVSLAAGYNFENGWRTEAEYTIKQDAEFLSGSTAFPTSFNHHKIDADRVMLNAYRDFKITSKIAAYGNIGIGVSRVKSSGWQGNQSRQYLANTETQLAYSVGAGLSYIPVKNTNVDLGYRFLDLAKIESGMNNFTNVRGLQDEQMKAHLYANEFYLGLRYQF